MIHVWNGAVCSDIEDDFVCLLCLRCYNLLTSSKFSATHAMSRITALSLFVLTWGEEDIFSIIRANAEVRNTLSFIHRLLTIDPHERKEW